MKHVTESLYYNMIGTLKKEKLMQQRTRQQIA